MVIVATITKFATIAIVGIIAFLVIKRSTEIGLGPAIGETGGGIGALGTGIGTGLGAVGTGLGGFFGGILDPLFSLRDLVFGGGSGVDTGNTGGVNEQFNKGDFSGGGSSPGIFFEGTKTVGTVGAGGSGNFEGEVTSIGGEVVNVVVESRGDCFITTLPSGTFEICEGKTTKIG